MKFVCQICGYVYDEQKEGIPFATLPDSWVCPLCKAPKAEFRPSEPEIKQVAVSDRDRDGDVSLPSDGQDALSAASLSAVCSNLARGCEMMYRPEEAELFARLSAYFDSIAPETEMPGIAGLLSALQRDIAEGYPALESAATAENDRGALRVKVWGEKVTRMLKSLIERYGEEGEAMLEHAGIWVCSVCGFTYIGDRAPDLCPVCKVPAWKFKRF